ncbi:small polypeptide DEVIL 6-like [Impatiens glandulifera]|nr:small polypeptide DEVIL 6-like [Impatiens glandulifera]
MKLGGSRKKGMSSSRKLGRFVRQQRARIYIIRRCIVTLLCWDDS